MPKELSDGHAGAHINPITQEAKAGKLKVSLAYTKSSKPTRVTYETLSERERQRLKERGRGGEGKKKRNGRIGYKKLPFKGHRVLLWDDSFCTGRVRWL